MKISFYSHPNSDAVIATKFSTWHDSCIVVACAKFCCDMITNSWITAKWNLHPNWIGARPQHWYHIIVFLAHYYSDVIVGVIASQITSLTIVYSNVYSGAGQRKHQSSASLAFVLGIHRWPHRWPVTRKMFPFDDVTCFVQQLTSRFGVDTGVSSRTHLHINKMAATLQTTFPNPFTRGKCCLKFHWSMFP